MRPFINTSLRLVCALACIAAAPAALANHSPANQEEPKLEIFANQLPILIGRGQPKSLTFTGAVYDGDIVFDGKVFIRPKNGTLASCPIFLNGDNFGVAVTGNTTNVPFRLAVLVPSNHPLGTFTCTLSYSGTQLNPVTRQTVPIPTLGNDVQFQYTVKNRFIF
ncbi:MAG TPA: hypothetical protein VEC06_16160 [Paucimonas sp.]|nr:hypothetical protein [Paucimonas sp.]